MRQTGGAAVAGHALHLGRSLNHWLDRDRCIAWCGALLALDVLALLFIIASAYGLVGDQRDPIAASFVSFYASGQLADTGSPALAYDQAAHEAAEDGALTPGIPHPVFNYPPVFLLTCAVLAQLPYIPAFIAFQTVTLIALLLAVRRILDAGGWGLRAWLAMLPFLAFPALWENLALGQNACLTAALFAWGLLLLSARPFLAGVVLGALCYKPHFGVLLPVALMAGERWRAMIGAALSVTVWVALSVAVFGVAPWLAYAAAVPAMPSFYASGHIAFAAMVSPLGAALVLGLSPTASAAVQAATAVAAAVVVAWVWRRNSTLALSAATLLAGTLLAAPLVLFYDQMIAAVAIAFLVRHARAVGWLPHEKALLGLAIAVSLFAPIFAAACNIPLGPLPALLLLGLCVAHAQAECSAASVASRGSV
jgi:alpha-1,2-mannosyltransferase